jgi:hypothetical protein
MIWLFQHIPWVHYFSFILDIGINSLNFTISENVRKFKAQTTWVFVNIYQNETSYIVILMKIHDAMFLQNI